MKRPMTINYARTVIGGKGACPANYIVLSSSACMAEKKPEIGALTFCSVELKLGFLVCFSLFNLCRIRYALIA